MDMPVRRLKRSAGTGRAVPAVPEEGLEGRKAPDACRGVRRPIEQAFQPD